MSNVDQLSLICAWNSFAINTVKLKQRITKGKIKTEQNAIALRNTFCFLKPNATKLWPLTICPYHVEINSTEAKVRLTKSKP